jgi:hypothetical protein
MSQQPRTLDPSSFRGHDLHPLFALRYQITHELGQGGHGVVFGGHRKNDGCPVAMKFVKKASVHSSSWVSISQREKIPLEVYILGHCRHPAIIPLLDYFDNGEFIYIVMEMHGTPWTATSAKQSLVLDPSALLVKPSPLGLLPQSAYPSSSPLTIQDKVPRSLIKQAPHDLFE